MPHKSRPRVKHIPQRTCVGCRMVLPKRSLIRIVRTEDGIRLDPTGKMAGRGAYLHDQRSCWMVGLKGSLANALKTELKANDRLTLELFVQTLPESESEPKE